MKGHDIVTKTDVDEGGKEGAEGGAIRPEGKDRQ